MRHSVAKEYRSVQDQTMSTTDCNVSRCLLFLLIGAMGFCEISGCKGSGGGGSLNLFGPTGPAPTISSLSPSSATAGSPSFTLTINGSNFASGDEIGWTLVTGSVDFHFRRLHQTYCSDPRSSNRFPHRSASICVGIRWKNLGPCEFHD